MSDLHLHLHLLLLFLLCHRPAASLTVDGLSLLALKSAAYNHPGDADSPFASWNTSDADPCRWLGVTCEYRSTDPRVVDVSLPGRRFRGYIPSELGSIASLRRLDLRGNRLSGPIPAQLFNATSLRTLILLGNNLSGAVPTQLCNLPHLQTLDLSSNFLSGEVPGGLASCRELQKLALAGNRLSGGIPAGVWSKLGRLVELDFSGNELEGPLPDDLGELRSLSGSLNFSFNRLSGELPRSLAKLPSTVKFDLRNNNLTGEIPSNGAFASQSASAFTGNPLLCGSFLINRPCNGSLSGVPGGRKGEPAAHPVVVRKRGLKYSSILIICIADAIGVTIIVLSIIYLYTKRRSSTDSAAGGSSFCCARVAGNRVPGAGPSENSGDDEVNGGDGGGGLVALEKGFKFELEELLQASAYVLGRTGPGGIVYKVVLGNGVPVAVRQLGNGGADRYKDFAAAAREVGRVRHPNVVRLRAFYWAPDEKLLISDYIPNGNLAAALRSRGGQKPSPALPWPTRLRVAKGAARGLAHIHDHGQRKCVHGDVKPANVLLDDNHDAVIADFGLARLLAILGVGGCDWPAIPAWRIGGYTAPEARLAWSEPSQRSDVYSFGVVVLELLTAKAVEAVASSSAGLGKGVEPELAKWVRKMLSEGRQVGELVDPAVVLEGPAMEEAERVLHVGLACTETDPELRPTMKSVSENLEKIGR